MITLAVITIASILAMITYAIFGVYAVVATWAFYLGMLFHSYITEGK